ncbi:hypothetical protein CDN99_26985 [Roseateles aquatilis]|uniref:Uncharacterized protein n=1 Tax=Roseateles aquatilis TaxID=431061 RepID=A0A2D0ALU4_9BURK|nr:hypothetical protein CDN99_26985 [Roseateles aquatilis]
MRSKSPPPASRWSLNTALGGGALFGPIHRALYGEWPDALQWATTAVLLVVVLRALQYLVQGFNKDC